MQQASIQGLDELMQGAVTERYANAMQQVIENILDLNTDAKKVRGITLNIKIYPNETRDIAEFSVEAKPKIAPRIPVHTTLLIGKENNQIVAREYKKGVTQGQIDMARVKGSSRPAQISTKRGIAWTS